MNRTSSTPSPLGGTAGILAGIAQLFVAVTYFMLPEPQRGHDTATYLLSVASDSFLLKLHFWGFVLTGVLSIALILAVYDRLRHTNEEWMRLITVLCIIAMAIVSLHYLVLYEHSPELATGFAAADASGQATIIAFGSRETDPEGWLRFGLIGLWMVMVNVLGMRHGYLPKTLAMIGIGAGLGYWGLTIGGEFDFDPLILLSAAMSGVFLGPLWFVWTGMILRRPQPAPQPELATATA